MTIILNSFVLRQKPDSRFGHTTLREGALLKRIRDHWGTVRTGYREGVVLVSVPPDRFFSGTVDLREGMPLKATYEPRRPGEVPRLHVGLDPNPLGGYKAAKQPAKAVDIVLYASTVLAEDGCNELPAVPGNWEVVSINPRLSVEEEPIHPDTLMANHFQESGGTATGMTDSEFVAALHKSRTYWNKKITLG